jgi:hypothetical protein
MNLICLLVFGFLGTFGTIKTLGTLVHWPNDSPIVLQIAEFVGLVLLLA